MTGTQIYPDMTEAASLPAEAWVPFVDPANDGVNQRIDLPATLQSYATLAALAAGTGSSLVGFLQTGDGAVARTVQSKLRDYLSVLDFGATGDGVTDDTAAVQAAVDAAKTLGKSLYAPEGDYLLSDTINFVTDLWMPSPLTVFAPGLVLVGDGIGKTNFISSASGPIFNVDVDTDHSSFRAVLGVVFQGMSIRKSGSPSGQHGIHLRAVYKCAIRQVSIVGLAGNGITIQCAAGDTDASNQVLLEQSEVRNCTGWGFSAVADSGFNEISFVELNQVSLVANGTSVVGTPTSGGMQWKGQILTTISVGISENENVGLYIPGAAGLANNCDLIDTVFENNKKRGIYVTGVDVMRARNIQLYNNDVLSATNQCEFDGASFTVRAVEFDGVVVRATSGNNPITAFKVSGTNAIANTIRIRAVEWENFDFAGQTRFDGVQFDHVVQCCRLADAGSDTSMLFEADQNMGTGNTSPLRLRGPNNSGGVGVASTSGEWVAIQLPAPRTLSSVGLTPDTTYNVYLYDNDGVVTMEASATAPVIDDASGYMVMDGDATKLWIGRVRTTAAVGGEFLRTNTGWLNPSIVNGSTMGSFQATWRDTATTPDRIYYKDGSLPTSVSDGQYVELT